VEGESAVVQVLGTAQDVTEQKQGEEDLRNAFETLEHKVAERTTELVQEKAFLEAVLENIEDSIVACDENGRLTLFNRASELLHGRPIAGV